MDAMRIRHRKAAEIKSGEVLYSRPSSKLEALGAPGSDSAASSLQERPTTKSGGTLDSFIVP